MIVTIAERYVEVRAFTESQWTASPYVAVPGFHAASGAVGEYNAKFIVNQQVLRGSACITAPGHARRTYRNFFPPDARWRSRKRCRTVSSFGMPSRL